MLCVWLVVMASANGRHVTHQTLIMSQCSWDKLNSHHSAAASGFDAIVLAFLDLFCKCASCRLQEQLDRLKLCKAVLVHQHNKQ